MHSQLGRWLLFTSMDVSPSSSSSPPWIVGTTVIGARQTACRHTPGLWTTKVDRWRVVDGRWTTHRGPPHERQLSTALGDLSPSMGTLSTGSPHLGMRRHRPVTGGVGSVGLARLGLDARCQVSDLVVQAAALADELADLAVCMHHRCVITAAEGLPDLG